MTGLGQNLISLNLPPSPLYETFNWAMARAVIVTR